MSVPKVSVLIPCHNAEKYVGETLESVFRQTWPEIEVIVVDDGSVDGSVGVVRSFARPALRLITQANRGAAAARNVCCTHATGEFVQFLDADDLIDPDKIGLQMQRLLTAPRCIASAEWGRFYQTHQETSFRPEPVWRDLTAVDWLAESELGMMFPALWLIPMPLVRAIGPWNERLTLGDDTEYYTRAVLAAERVLFCAGARCHYRSGISASLSGTRSAGALISAFAAADLCEGHVRAVEDSERIRRMFAILWQRFGYLSYPYSPPLAKRAASRARNLHSIRIRPEGGPRFQALSRVIGWRAVRRMQVALGGM